MLSISAPDQRAFTHGPLKRWSGCQERHPIGTKARLALALLCFTGQRRSDIIRFGKQHVRNGLLTFTQHKGRNKKPKCLSGEKLNPLNHL